MWMENSLIIWLCILIYSYYRGHQRSKMLYNKWSRSMWDLLCTRNIDFLKIHVVSDALEVVIMFKGAEDSSIRNFVADINGVSNSFIFVKFNYASKQFDTTAHNLAKFSFDHNKSFDWASWLLSYLSCWLGS